MARLQKIKKYLLLPALFCALAAPAHAASVTNLSGSAQIVGIEDHSQPSGFTEVTIDNGQTYQMPLGDINVRCNGRDTRLDYHTNYAIWKEGYIWPQVRQRAVTRL